MKAVIVSLRGSYAAALCDDGSVRRLKNTQYALGQEIVLQPLRSQNFRLSLRLACAAAILALTVLPAYAYYAPYSYVSLDVNPSIEFSLNRFDRVLSFRAFGGSGAEVLANLSLKHKDIQDAVKLTLSAMADDGYLTADVPGAVVITASSKNEKKSEQLSGALAETVQETADAEAVEVEVEAEGIGQARVQQAQEIGITPGKLRQIEKLQESAENPGEFTVEAWTDKTIQEIREKTKENKEKNSQQNGKDSPSAGRETSGANAGER